VEQQQGSKLVIEQTGRGPSSAHYALHMIHEELQVISGYAEDS